MILPMVKEHVVTCLKYLIVIVFVHFFFLSPFQLSAQSNLKLHYSFVHLTDGDTQVVDESGNGYTGKLANGATVRQYGSSQVLDLGSANGYLDFGASLGSLISSLSDFSVATYLYIDPTASVTDNGNFVWSFGNSNNMAADGNGGMFFTAKSTRFATSLTNWSAEQAVNYNSAFAKGVWKHVVYVQSGTTGTIYLDGVSKKSGTISIIPGSLGATSFNYIGRALYNADAYLKKSLLADFRIYNKALTADEIKSLTADLDNLNNVLIQQQLTTAVSVLALPGTNKVSSDLGLPAVAGNGIAIKWSSSNTSVISDLGAVTRPSIGSDSVKVDLTATLSKKGQTQTKLFTVYVLPYFTDQASVDRDKGNITFTGNNTNLRTSLNLPSKGIEGSVITWLSDNSAYLTSAGKFLKLAPKGGGKVKVNLTATVTKGKAASKKTFSIYIAEDEGFTSYLFVYFTGNNIKQEAIRFALSNDGYTYRALNNGNPVIESSVISSTGGVRDPHIYRGPDGKYYMVVTDMVSDLGWSSNRAMVLLRSNDLINWQSSVVNLQTKYNYADLKRVWAPQTIYDEKAGKFMIYFSMQRGNGPDIIYYAYANTNFTDIEAEPVQLYFSPTNSSCIDGDIIFSNGKYHLFHKTEGSGNGIKKAVSDNLTSGYVLYNQYLQQTTEAVEGSSVFKLINSDDYILMYDLYASGKYQFTRSSDLLNFKVIQSEISMNFTPRHGTVMPITASETKALSEKWGTVGNLTPWTVDGSFVKTRNVIIDTIARTVYLPVKREANLSSLVPGIKSLPGAMVSPAIASNFSKGPVTYTLSLNGKESRSYTVTAKKDHNPVLDGYYADPEILYAHKTGKYYLYPTSDGFTGWSGTYFKTFSSDNLVDWKDEGVILDLPTNVSWGTTNAWAPTIIERKINGEYKYFYYFCASQKVGVAVSDSPTGPFVDRGAPLIADRPAGARGGQQIDPDVFLDPVSGKYFIYWGNSYMACAELNDDMVSINTSTVKILNPNSTYREGTEVIYRNGVYYFFWSEDDTRSENYRVRYAMSTSPTGTFTYADNSLVIAKDAAKGIYGTGHNCILQVPGKDEWYIIYHRFTRPKGISMGDAAGYFREVCIDAMKFNADGTIIQVQPTLEGISPINANTGRK